MKTLRYIIAGLLLGLLLLPINAQPTQPAADFKKYTVKLVQGGDRDILVRIPERVKTGSITHAVFKSLYFRTYVQAYLAKYNDYLAMVSQRWEWDKSEKAKANLELYRSRRLVTIRDPDDIVPDDSGGVRTYRREATLDHARASAGLAASDDVDLLLKMEKK